ncbi:MAG: aspartyl protease family protein [Gammaproteobacteria bacterium]|nr:aspartyl protease family protein [Gammaproteobacteria bacterium]MDH5801450.1 aspartyl protease family protein [Gammaproteobacteria bacterium]
MVRKIVVYALFTFVSLSSSAIETTQTIALQNLGLGTYYVNVGLPGVPKTPFMLDTGSGYATINESTLAILKQNKQAQFVKEIHGILANGKKTVVPIWSVSRLILNDICVLKNIEVAVFPGKTRQILGLSALKAVAPLQISFDPPVLTLHQCIQT